MDQHYPPVACTARSVTRERRRSSGCDFDLLGSTKGRPKRRASEAAGGTFSGMPETLNDYVVLKELGRGASSVVSLACHHYTNELVCLKAMHTKKEKTWKRAMFMNRMDVEADESVDNDDRDLRETSVSESSCHSVGAPSQRSNSSSGSFADRGSAAPASITEREIAVMQLIEHPNIVNLRGVIEDDDDLMTYLILDYCQEGPLMHFLRRSAAAKQDTTAQHHEYLRCTVVRPLDRVASYARQIALALEYLHQRRIVHRDVKPDNILKVDENTVKLSDFGMSGLLPPDDDREGNVQPTAAQPQPISDGHVPLLQGPELTRILSTACLHGSDFGGTPAFMAPEAYHSSKPTLAQDCWAFGVTLYMMLFGRHPFPSSSALGKEAKEASFSKVPNPGRSLSLRRSDGGAQEKDPSSPLVSSRKKFSIVHLTSAEDLPQSDGLPRPEVRSGGCVNDPPGSGEHSLEVSLNANGERKEVNNSGGLSQKSSSVSPAMLTPLVDRSTVSAYSLATGQSEVSICYLDDVTFPEPEAVPQPEDLTAMVLEPWKDALRLLLHPDPALRLTMSEFLQHPCLRGDGRPSHEAKSSREGSPLSCSSDDNAVANAVTNASSDVGPTLNVERVCEERSTGASLQKRISRDPIPLTGLPVLSVITPPKRGGAGQAGCKPSADVPLAAGSADAAAILP